MCALTTAGAVWCCGDNVYGDLGNGSTISSSVPVAVTGLSSPVRAVTAGWYHTCALTTAGAVSCWGDNSNGKLGNGSNVSSDVPVAVMGLSLGVQGIAAGAGHTCALTAAGGVQCWGANSAGELGNGSTTDSWTPVDAMGLSSGIQAITVGSSHSCALTTAGAVSCWGFNQFGQVGNGSTTDSHVPVAVAGLLSGIQAISAGDGHTCALAAGGRIQCWGSNDLGNLGNGTNTDSSVPVEVSGF
jgi:alpha-tubulin suppressor-like RCC1 family protein